MSDPADSREGRFQYWQTERCQMEIRRASICWRLVETIWLKLSNRAYHLAEAMQRSLSSGYHLALSCHRLSASVIGGLRLQSLQDCAEEFQAAAIVAVAIAATTEGNLIGRLVNTVLIAFNCAASCNPPSDVPNGMAMCVRNARGCRSLGSKSEEQTSTLKTMNIIH